MNDWTTEDNLRWYLNFNQLTQNIRMSLESQWNEISNRESKSSATNKWRSCGMPFPHFRNSNTVGTGLINEIWIDEMNWNQIWLETHLVDTCQHYPFSPSQFIKLVPFLVSIRFCADHWKWFEILLMQFIHSNLSLIKCVWWSSMSNFSVSRHEV